MAKLTFNRHSVTLFETQARSVFFIYSSFNDSSNDVFKPEKDRFIFLEFSSGRGSIIILSTLSRLTSQYMALLDNKI